MKNLILAISALLAAVSAGTNACAAENVSVPGEYALLSTPTSSEYPTLYYCYNDDADKFAKKNFYYLMYDGHKYKFKSDENGVRWNAHCIFSTCEDDKYVYFVEFKPDYKIKQYSKTMGSTWQKDNSFCKLKKSAGYSEFFKRHFKELDLTYHDKCMLYEAKDENFYFSYNVSEKTIVLEDITMRKKYKGDDAIKFIRSGNLGYSSEERKEKAALAKKMEKEKNEMDRTTGEWPFLKNKNIVKAWHVSVCFHEGGGVVSEKERFKHFGWLYRKRICTIVCCGSSRSDITNIYVLPPIEDEAEEYNYKPNGMFRVTSNQWLTKRSTSSKVAPPELYYITDEDYGYYTLNVRYNGKRYDVPIHKSDVEILDKLLDSKANKTSVKHGRGIYIGVGTIGANGYQPIK